MSETIFAEGILNGHVAFVTGGGTGITGGVARALAESGAAVALVSRKMDHLQPAADAINQNGGKALAVAADVRQPEAVENAVAQTIEHFGKIDIVVNGAAGNFLCPAEELSSNGFGTVVDIDLKGTFNVCRAAFAELKKERGQILSISATLHYTGTPLQLHVSAAKAGVDVQNLPPPLFEFVEGRAADVESSLEVNVNNRPDPVGRKLLSRAKKISRRAVDDDVQLAETFDRRGHGSFDLR